MKVDIFDYELPQELIAQTPAEKRDSSRLLMLNKSTGEIEHGHFTDIKSKLRPGDCLVLNNTRVIPARLIGQRSNGGEAELLLLRRIDTYSWETMVRPGKKLRTGKEIVFGDGKLKGTITEELENGNRVVRFEFDGIFEEVLNELGEMPLPPYITEKLADKERYQTVYSHELGSAAAPTAGLHFTTELMDRIKAKGVKIAYVTLHVGLGTFRPVKVENIQEHHMHSELFVVTEEEAAKINAARAAGGRIICVGTTSLRTLESTTDENGIVHADSRETDIFIYPGYKFKAADCLITNFHLPESTLLMLVSAFSSREIMLRAYAEAIEQRYRFFSFGDAMFIA